MTETETETEGMESIRRRRRMSVMSIDWSGSMAKSLKKVAKRAADYRHVLLVMRHAKAEPFNISGDRNRTITDRGVKQAKTVAKGLLDLGLVPQRVACSGALRAQQTLERMLKTFGDGPKVDYRQSLYEGGVQAVFDEISHTKDKTKILMIVGHEPTVSISCQWLANSQSDPELLDLLSIGLSSASVVVFGSHDHFSDWKVHTADLIAVLSAKDFDR